MYGGPWDVRFRFATVEQVVKANETAKPGWFANPHPPTISHSLCTQGSNPGAAGFEVDGESSPLAFDVRFPQAFAQIETKIKIEGFSIINSLISISVLISVSICFSRSLSRSALPLSP
jgi:hypothetical protein